MSPKGFRVIIAGGSIAGLAQALMLEKNKIDFLVLEAYPEIAPQVGASIGLLPNGLRILDQIGCYEAVMEMAQVPVREVYFRRPTGEIFWSFDKFSEQSTERHGYPLIFLDRRMVIEVLYNHIQDKSKVLTSKRVMSIEHTDSGVQVRTKDGTIYSGDIIIGADGVRSTVRRQMWDAANRLEPSWIPPSEETALPATYACIFGISTAVPGIKSGTLHSVFNEHFSYLVPGGPGDRSYWFLVFNMGKTYYGPEIPRFTKEEEEEIARKHWNDPITEDVRFSDLYTRKISSVCTPLPEYVYEKWHFGRIMTVGDSCHKFEPLTGQGGNNAIETAAALTNCLVQALGKSRTGQLSNAEVKSIFDSVQKLRSARVQRLVSESHNRQRVEAMETPFLKAVATYLIPALSHSRVYNNWVQSYCSAVSLDMLPMPPKPRQIPFHDELFHRPQDRGIVAILLYITFGVFALLAYRLLFLAGMANGTWTLVRETVKQGAILDIGIHLQDRFVGLRGVDAKLKGLVTIFLPVVTGRWNIAHKMQLMYFLASTFPLVAIFTIEAYRKRNAWTLIWSSSLWGVLYQLQGIGVVAPLYYMASVFTSRNASYYAPPSRVVPVTKAEALFPGLVIGYLVPTALLFLPYPESTLLQSAIAFWQLVPILAVVCTEAIAYLMPFTSISDPKSGDTNSDIPYLTKIYKFTGFVAAFTHLATVIATVLSPDLALADIFIAWNSFAPVRTFAEGVFIFFQNDFLTCSAATFLFCLASIWDLYRIGVSNVDWLKGLAALCAGFVLVGPGATAATVWWWREHVLSAQAPKARSGLKALH